MDSKSQPPDARARQWGGRFAVEPDAHLLAFGSSFEDDLALAPFDVACSRAHVASLRSGGIISGDAAKALDDALVVVADEIASGAFTPWARGGGFEDIHGAVDARVRELAPGAGDSLHAGRSRNDQVATDLVLYARDRAESGRATCVRIARLALERARVELAAGTLVAATTHWQPAQPISLALWLEAVAEMFARAARRFEHVRDDATRFSPLGSGACSGSTLPLDSALAARELGFAGPPRNALDAIGDRDVVLDLLHAAGRALVSASRVSEEIVLWCAPAFGYATLDDAASTGSSLMPQKRNPDPFELVRGNASRVMGALAGAVGATTGIALSYHKDLQETKSLVVRGTERALATLDAFERAFGYVRFDTERMTAHAGDGYTLATDLADALIARGVTARAAHAAVGAVVAAAASEGRALDERDLVVLGRATPMGDVLHAPLDPAASVAAKRSAGSTNPTEIAHAIAALERELDEMHAP